MPKGWDDLELFTCSPRHLDAAITRTCQVLLEGKYQNMFEAHRNCFFLKHDYSNAVEILRTIQSPEITTMLAEQAHQDLVQSGKYFYSVFAQEVEDAIQAAT
jgi:hypothetical protein